MIKNIFLTGKPRCGKTTLIMEILEQLKPNGNGFYTQEILKNGKRLGFKITTLNGKEGILAHIEIKSPYRLGKYKINIKDFENIGVRSILDSLKENKITVIDEIGKMELHSDKFKKAVKIALKSKNKVLGTIMVKSNPFCDEIKKRKDTKILYLTRKNKEKIKKEIIKFLESK